MTETSCISEQEVNSYKAIGLAISYDKIVAIMKNTKTTNQDDKNRILVIY